ncbi:hypothetical protein D3C84_1058400 [compost metagenome]
MSLLPRAVIIPRRLRRRMEVRIFSSSFFLSRSVPPERLLTMRSSSFSSARPSTSSCNSAMVKTPSEASLSGLK